MPIESNPKLLNMLAQNRNDKATWQVYADWLLEQNEKWGEVIVKVCKGERQPDELEKVEALLDDLDGSRMLFDFGVVNRLDLQPEEEDEDEKMYEVLGNVLKHPAGHHVATLVLGLPPNTDTEWNFDGVLSTLGEVGTLPLLTSIDMSPDADHMDQPSWRRIGDVSVLWRVAPRLQHLKMQGSAGSDDGVPIRFGKIDAPWLKSIEFISSGLSKAAPQEIGAGNLPALERLELYFGQSDYGNDCSLSDLDPILNGESLPKLQILGIMNSEWEGDMIEKVANAPIVKRLRGLDFSKGILAQQGAEALIANAASLRHLESINLDENFISEELATTLKQALPCVRLGTQREPDGDYRYVVVGE